MFERRRRQRGYRRGWRDGLMYGHGTADLLGDHAYAAGYQEGLDDAQRSRRSIIRETSALLGEAARRR